MKNFKIYSLLSVLLLGMLHESFAQKHELLLQGRWNYSQIPVRHNMRYNDIWGYAAPDGREYAIMGSLDSIYFIEVTDPNHPVLRDVEAGADTSCIHRDFKTHGKYCYAVADQGNSSLQIFDLSYLPDSVHKVYDSDSLSQRCHNIFISDDNLYFASNLHSKWGRIAMSTASLANPKNPVFNAHLSPLVIEEEVLFSKVHDVFVKNGMAFCSNGNGGLYIYDYTDPYNKKLVSVIKDYPDKGYNHSSWLTEDDKYLVFADETHGMKLKCFDVSNLERPLYVSTFHSNADKGSIPHNPFIVGEMIFVSYYHDGLVVFSISDPENIVEVAAFDTYPENSDTSYNNFQGCWGTYPFLPSGTILASDMSHGLFTFKLTNWETPFKIKGKEDAQIIRLNTTYWTDNELKVLFTDVYEGPLTIQLYDMQGRLIFSEHKNTLSQIVPLQIPSQKSGMYLLKINTIQHEKTFKIYAAKQAN